MEDNNSYTFVSQVITTNPELVDTQVFDHYRRIMTTGSRQDLKCMFNYAQNIVSAPPEEIVYYSHAEIQFSHEIVNDYSNGTLQQMAFGDVIDNSSNKRIKLAH